VENTTQTEQQAQYTVDNVLVGHYQIVHGNNMTPKQIAKLEKKLEELYNEIPKKTGLLDIVREIVDIELQLEKECNQ